MRRACYSNQSAFADVNSEKAINPEQAGSLVSRNGQSTDAKQLGPKLSATCDAAAATPPGKVSYPSVRGLSDRRGRN
jgi:hypothetical protein